MLARSVPIREANQEYDKSAGGRIGRAKPARRVQARDGLQQSTRDTRIFSEQISRPYVTHGIASKQLAAGTYFNAATIVYS